MIKKLIADLKSKYSIKHYGIGLKKYPELVEKIEELKIKYPNMTASAYLYILENDVIPVCPNGKTLTFKDYTKGFIFCGRAGSCKCAKDQVSKSVKEAKSKTTKEEIEKQNKKREQTNKEKYGVSNTGQIDKAKQAHKEFYLDPEKVQNTLEKMKKTCIDRYGVDNPLKLPEFKEERLIAKYGVDNPLKLQKYKDEQSERQIRLGKTGIFLKFGYEKLKKYLYDNLEWELITPVEEYKGAKHQDIRYTVKCINCNTEHDLKINYTKMYKCKICYPTEYTYRSKQENQVFDYIQSLGVKCYQKDKSIINPFELDIVCPDHKIAIEYCGLYWHSEFSQGKDKNYHKIKMDKCNNKGYRLITLFSDEWLYKNDVVKKFFNNIFGLETNKLGARKTETRLVNNYDKNIFLETNHIQGTVGSTLNYGLYYNDELVSVMCFRKEKIISNSDLYKTSDGYYWNLTRFATKCLVQGGASKLLSQFIKDNDPELIVSFADQRISEGNLYEKIGFEYYGCMTPTYYYIGDKFEKRYHKFNFRKNKIEKIAKSLNFDLGTGWTEKEAMQNLGYDRIWDCGKKRYIWRK